MHCFRCGSPLLSEGETCKVCGYSKCINIPLNRENTENPLDPEIKKTSSVPLLKDRYEVLQRLHAGGMGIIYKVWDHNLQKEMALKEMMDRFMDPLMKENAPQWFFREARMLSDLRHAHLPVVTDYFTHENKYYLVMDFIRGKSLTELSLPMQEEEVMKFALISLEILDYLHKNKIIHRDIKSGNFMKEDHTGKYFLVDFGTARIFDTQKGKTLIGTPGFASPEHFKGTPDHRSDLYSLGATLHHLLTGIDPSFEPPFSFKPVLSIVPNINPILAKAVDGSLAYNAENRFSSAEDMLKFLQNQPAQKEIEEKPAKKIEKRDKIEIPAKKTLSLQEPVYTSDLRETRGSIPSVLEPAYESAPSRERKKPSLQDLLAEPSYDGYSDKKKRREISASTVASRPAKDTRLYRTLRSQVEGSISRIGFSSERNLAVGYCTGEIGIFDVSRGERLSTLQRHVTSSPVLCNDISVSPDGTAVAQALDNRQIIIWNLISGRKMGTLIGHGRGVHRVQFMTDRILSSGDSGGIIRIWDVHHMLELLVLDPGDGEITALGSSWDGKFLVSGSSKGILRLFDLSVISREKPVTTCTTPGHRGDIREIRFSPHQDDMLSTGIDGQVRRWKLKKSPLTLESGKLVYHDNCGVNAVAFSPGGNFFVVGTDYGKLHFFNIGQQKAFLSIDSLSEAVKSLSISYDGHYIASASERGNTQIHEV